MYCCAPCVIGLAKGRLDKSGFDVLACLCSGLSAYRLRRRVQEMFGIKETEDASMCAVGLCGLCASAQDVSELVSRGAIEPLLGAAKTKAVQPTGTAEMNQA